MRWLSAWTAFMYFILARAASVRLPRGPRVEQISWCSSSTLSGLVARWYRRNEALDPAKFGIFPTDMPSYKPCVCITCGVNPSSERVDGHDEGDGGVLATPGHKLGQHSLAVLTQAGHGGAQMLLTYIHVLICQPNTHNIQIT